MLLHIPLHQPPHPNRLLNIRKKQVLLTSMMIMHHSMPTQTVTDEIFVIGGLDVWSLDVDTVEASLKYVVDHTHLTCGF